MLKIRWGVRILEGEGAEKQLGGGGGEKKFWGESRGGGGFKNNWEGGGVKQI